MLDRRSLALVIGSSCQREVFDRKTEFSLDSDGDSGSFRPREHACDRVKGEPIHETAVHVPQKVTAGDVAVEQLFSLRVDRRNFPCPVLSSSSRSQRDPDATPRIDFLWVQEVSVLTASCRDSTGR
eukprot:767955-Hanusia_phi.AAC.1